MNISFSIGLFFSFHRWKQKDAMITSGFKSLPPRIDSDFPPTCAQRRRPSSESSKKSSAKSQTPSWKSWGFATGHDGLEKKVPKHIPPKLANPKEKEHISLKWSNNIHKVFNCLGGISSCCLK